MSQKIEVVVTALDQTQQAFSGLQKALKDAQSELGNLSGKAEDTSRRTKTATEQMTSDWTRMATAFTAGNLMAKGIEQAVELMMKLKEYIADAARYAARVETLGISMLVVGNNAGYSSQQMDQYEKSVKAMGITTEASRESLVKMAASEIDLSKASQLARVAQDAAVVGNINSSEAFSRMVQGIRSGEVEILRNIGISVQFEQGYKKAASQMGKTTEQLTEHEKVVSRTNQVLAEGTKMQGIYEAAMGTTGKQLTSMARYYDELKLAFGEAFAPALGVIIEKTTENLKALLKHFEDNKGAYKEFAQNLADIVRAAAHPVDTIQKLAYGSFNGTAVDERMGIEAQNRANTEAANKELAEAKERQRRRMGEESRAARAQEEAAIAASKGVKKALKEQAEYRKKYEDEIIKASEDERKRRAKAEHDDATRFLKMLEDEGKTQDKLQADRSKAAKHEADVFLKILEDTYQEQKRLKEERSAASRLAIENKLAEIDVEERFYQITAGSAAEQRITLLQQALDLENKAFLEAKGRPLLQEELMTKIIGTNAKLLDQQKILADSTAWGGAKAAMQEYIRAANDAGAQTKGLTNDIMRSMEDSLVKAAQTGRLSFKDMVDSIEADLLRMASKQIVAGAANGVLTIVTSADQNAWFGKLMTGLTSAIGLNTLATEKNTASQASGGVTGGAGGTAGAGALGGAGGFVAGALVFAGITAAIQNGLRRSHSSEGVDLEVNNGSVSGNIYKNTTNRSGWGRKRSFETQFELDAMWKNFVNDQFTAIKEAMQLGASGMGKGSGYIEEIMRSFSMSSTRLNLAGKSAEEQKKAVEEYFRKLSNEALKAAYPALQSMQRLGEDLTATYQRVEELRLRNNSLMMQELELMGRSGSAGYMELLNNQRQAELLGMEESTRAIQRRIWALQDEQQAAERLIAMSEGKESLLIRTLRATGNDAEASLREMIAKHYAERREAEQSGLLNLADLERVQLLERNKLITDIQTDANDRLVSASRDYASQMANVADNLNLKISALNMIKELKTGPLSGLSPEAQYRQMQGMFSTTSDPATIKAFVEASRAYYGSSSGYQGDLQSALDKLGGLGGIGASPTLDLAQKQLDQLEMIRIATENNTTVAMAQLAVADAQRTANIATELQGAVAALLPTIDLQQVSATTQALDALRPASGWIVDPATGTTVKRMYAAGGIANVPSIFGDAGPEAAVPLPDGRRIPVQLSGAADNRKMEDLLEKVLNKLSDIESPLKRVVASR